MTSSPPETEVSEEGAPEEAPHPLAGYAEEVAAAVGGEGRVTFDTVKVTVEPEQWVEALRIARDDLDLVLFSFLSAIDWSNDPAVGEPLSEEVEAHFEVLATVGDVTEGRRVTFSTPIPHDSPTLPSLVGVYAGANWHEREAHEMFGIDFPGHPDLSLLYLPEGFLGHPLLKSFPLLSREVKPWPGTVDVEDMPEEEEEPEAAEEGDEGDEGDEAAGDEDAGEASPDADEEAGGASPDADEEAGGASPDADEEAGGASPDADDDGEEA